MNQEQWTAVDAYLGAALLSPDPALEATRLANSNAGLPAIDVSPCQGKLLYLLALMLGARRILEIGTLGGYSTIWMAKALPPEGLLVTLEADPKHALAFGLPHWLPFIIIGPSLLMRLPCLDRPRFRSMGWSPWLVLLLLIPFLNLIVQLILFTYPPENADA